MTDTWSRMDLKEFHEAGLLAQANEQFFWPLGLALTIAKEEDGSVSELFIQRVNPYGVIHAGEGYDERVERAERVEAWMKSRIG